MSKRLSYSPEAKDHLIRMLGLFEAKKLQSHEIKLLFQDLIDTGLAWQLDEKYSRVATHLIKEGTLLPPPSGFIPPDQTMSDLVVRRQRSH